jgi:predicted Holliday junction resolvase-like endonuclease
MNPYIIIAIIVVTLLLLNMLSTIRHQKRELEQLKNELQQFSVKNKQLEDQIEVMDMEMDLLEDIYNSKIKEIYKDVTDKKPIHFTF